MSLSGAEQRIKARFIAVEQAMADAPQPEDYVRLGREYAELQQIVAAMQRRDALREEELSLTHLAETEDDPDLTKLALEEIETISLRYAEAEQELHLLMLPENRLDQRNAVLEIRPGTGGDEAGLFALDLMRMYRRYTEIRGWAWNVMTFNEIERGGLRELIVHIPGERVFERLKHESGVHRVQRVPVTETQGRIHTSAATVAVLPEAHEVDIRIDPKDIRIDVYRASGPGGQSVNTTDSAVRITHIPSGVVVMQQDEKSQHKNRDKAMRILKARLFERERQREHDERAATRRSQIGRGDRSERIRTYNFPQNRVTDHRIGLTLYKLDAILDGTALDALIEPLRIAERAEQLGAVGGNRESDEEA